MGEDVVVLDDRGRVLIPRKYRLLLRLKPKTRLKIRVAEGAIMLEPEIPKPKTVKSGRKWGKEAFLDAGEATFGEY
ncbi:MAG: AbrB/MazE/SpoVT family DNA-binding domain-containing protein [Candidatus Asgardarchaeia archaeon]